jgi:hypothetical protein
MAIKVINSMNEFKKVRTAINNAVKASNTLMSTDSKLLDNIHDDLEKAQRGINRFINILERRGDHY